MDAERKRERLRGIGGSDAAAALGLSQFSGKTRYLLWLEKTCGIRDAEETEPMFWGKVHEPAILRRYADTTGRELRQLADLTWSRDNPWMFASVDAVANDADGRLRIVEAKTAATRTGWGEPGTDEIPVDYLLQAAHYLAVFGDLASVVDVPVLFHGNRLEIYVVERDRAMERDLIECERQFWELVRTNTPPEVDTEEDARTRWPRSLPTGALASGEDVDRLHELRDVRQRMGELAQREGDLRAALMASMGDREALLGADGKALVTWKTARDGERLDLDRLRKERPEIVADYSTVRPGARTFLIKGERP